jgi:hypothetical protein
MAERWRAVGAVGRDPVKERKAEAWAAKRADIWLAVLTADAFEARKAELKEDGAAGRWLSPLTIHGLPRLGKVAVADIDQRDVRDILAPLWHATADMGRKPLNRLGMVFEHAAAPRRNPDLQAPDKAAPVSANPAMNRGTHGHCTGANWRPWMPAWRNRPRCIWPCVC